LSHKFTRALCRRPGLDLAAGITTSGLGAPDFILACEHFDRYVALLDECGLDVTVLEALEGFPDAHFVEDTAVVTPDVAVITHPGAPARQGEQHTIAKAMAEHRTLAKIESPGTLDGGDILMIGTHFLIGVSDRTNDEGARQLGAILESHGNTWQAVPVAAGLHFKSSVRADHSAARRGVCRQHPADQRAADHADRVSRNPVQAGGYGHAHHRTGHQ